MPTATKVREVRGLINAAKKVFIWVDYADHEDGCYPLQISRPQAKEICEDAEEHEIKEIVVDVRKGGKEIYIGDVDISDEDDADEEEGADEEEEEEEEEEEAEEGVSAE